VHAFVRFRCLRGSPPRYVAHIATVHDVLRRAAPFFVDRFATMQWTITTPQVTAHWDGRTLAFGPPPDVPAPPPDDETEALWLAYYDSIFNPARLNERLQRRAMPVRYWAGLPEARRIPVLVAAARSRTAAMIAHASDPSGGLRAAAPKRPPHDGEFGADDGPLKARLDACRRCDLYRNATQGVAGRGPARAKLMLVGEQPGDEEDLAGEPFVGPAGRLLAKALEEAGVDPARVYVTNAVKHFKWEPRGKRRIHKTPAQREVEACHVWLDGEIARERPRVLVALGATALTALLERKMAIRDARGTVLQHASGATIVATYHPSAALRAPTPEMREQTYRAIVDDLRHAQAAAEPGAGPASAARE
jgi:DNA polymerase